MRVETLDNGIKLYAVPIEGIETIGIGIYVNIGSIYEEKEYRGISHLLEHMMFKTNRKYKASEIDMGLELNGGFANAMTSTHYTIYFVECIKEKFDKIIDILFSMFENDKFLEDEFEKEKKVIISEIERIRNDPEERLFSLIQRSVFGDSDYGEEIGGSRESVENITKDILEEFKAKYYTPKNMFILLEGNVTEKDIEIVKRYFSKLEGDRPKLKEPNKERGRSITEYMETGGQIYYALSTSFNLTDYLKAYTLSILLSGGMSSKIFQIFRNKYGIGYHILLEEIVTFPDSFIFSLAIPGFEQEKEREVYNAINDLLEEKVDKEYIEGRLRRFELKFQKTRKLLFERLPVDAFLINHFSITYDNLLEIVKKYSNNYDELKKMLENLTNGYEVWIKPK